MALNRSSRAVAGYRPASTRVYEIARREQQLERAVALASVIVPTIGAVAAGAAAFAWGVGRAEVVIWAAGHALTGFGIAIGYHRLVSHRAFETKRWISATFIILGSMCLQGPVLWWAAIHRRHHSTSERPGDPHSPYVKDERMFSGLRGFWHSHIGWLFVHENTDWMHYVPELLRDPMMFRLNQLYFLWVFLGLAIPAAIGAAVHWSWQGAVLGFLWGGMLRIFTTQHATWCINSVCHIFGSRPFECREEARNNILIVLPTMGEGWHNNHHSFPNTAINQFTWWQVDPSGMLVRLLQATGLAWKVQFPSREARESYRRELQARVMRAGGAPN